MSGCKIQTNTGMKKWEIAPGTLKHLYPLLYKKIEIGGKFTFPINKQGVVKRISSIKKIHTMNGASDSVQAPEGLANFHTHPLSCYIGEETVWGWPSGEDIRETLLFGMKGSLVHLVIAIEGIYSLQINPCILSSFMHIESEIESVLSEMKRSKKSKQLLGYIITKYISHFKKSGNQESKLYLRSKGIKTRAQLNKYLKLVKSEYLQWNKSKQSEDLEYLTDFVSDIFRGLIVLYIEIYYRSSHRFRGNDLEFQLFPIDFVKFVNSFKISNIFSTNKRIEGCGKLKCGGVPVYENNKTKSSHFSKYVNSYEKDTGFYMVSKHGETLSLSIMLKKLTNFVPYVEDITIGNNCSNKKLGSWKKNWFKMSFVPNDIVLNDRKIRYISKRIDNQTRIDFLNYYFKESDSNPDPNVISLDSNNGPIFYYYNIKGQCDHQDVTKDLMSYKPTTATSNRRRRRSKKKFNIVIYGTTRCGWCKRATKKFDKKGIKYTKKYYPTINEAINEANKLNSKIDSVPAIFVNNKYLGSSTSKAVKYIIKNV
jgi:glutaredoxin